MKTHKLEAEEEVFKDLKEGEEQFLVKDKPKEEIEKGDVAQFVEVKEETKEPTGEELKREIVDVKKVVTYDEGPKLVPKIEVDPTKEVE
jgi:hypothetical protein